MTAPTPAQLIAFRQAFAGEVILPGDSEYDEARRVWSGLYDRRPAVIVRPTSTAGVAAAIRFARDRDLALVVRGGSHSAAGHSTGDGALVVDLGRLRGVTVEPDTRIARANGGALLSELDAAGQARGLVCPVGVIGHTGVGGLTLGGGMGRLQRKFGLTIDNLRAVELVTADGRTVRASVEEEPELFWGVRGAGANLGVVTAFEFELQPFSGTLHRGLRMYDAAHVQDVWSLYRDFAATAPDEVSMTFGMGRAVPESDYPESVAGRPVVFVAFGHCGDAGDVERDLAPLRAGPEPVVNNFAPVNYLELQTANDEAMSAGHRSYINGGFTNDLRPGTLDALIEHVADAPGEAGIGLAAFGGAVGRVADDATAFPSRTAAFEMSADAGFWEDVAEDDRYIGWTVEAMAILNGDACDGRYLNEITESGEDVSRSIYGEAKYGQIAALKRAWDPENVFRSNHNVAP